MTPWVLLRKFRRRYLWASEVYEKLSKIGPLSLHIEGRKDESEGFWIKAENRVPDEDLIMRLAVLMYPLLDPSSDSYWQKILTTFNETFAEEIPQTLQEQLESQTRRLSQVGPMAIKFNDECLEPPRIYLLICKGLYFGQESQARSEIEKFLAVPIMGPILWNCFYDYTMAGFALSSVLYDVFLEVRKTARFQDLYPADVTSPKQCIYCRTSEGSFSSEEHVVPESLGNDELVLEKGYVCDRCNNGLLAFLDQILLEFGPISFFKMLYVPHGKGGKLPSANFQNMKIIRTTPAHIEIVPKDKSGFLQEEKDLGDGRVRFNISINAALPNPSLVARAYFKIALGTVAYDRSAEFALGELYEPARAFIRGEQGFPNPLIIKTQGEPNEHIQVTWQKLNPGTVFRIDIFGVVAVFNLEVEPSVQVEDTFDNSGFIVFNLSKSDRIK